MEYIMIDAGHGPETAGKRSPDGTLREFTFNSAVAQTVKRLLVAEGVSVHFSHDPHRDVPLHECTSKANQLGVDAFVSIHANAYGNSYNEANGIETYVYPTGSRDSFLLANIVQSSLISAVQRKDRGVKQANFAVLRDTKMPAILVECGFMTNRTELMLLMNKAYREQCARAIAFGILCYLYNK